MSSMMETPPQRGVSMNFLKKLFVILGPRIGGAAVGYVVAEGAKRGITVDPAAITAIAIGAYGVAHKVISAKVNPGDAASPKLAAAEKDAVQTNTTVKVQPTL